MKATRIHLLRHGQIEGFEQKRYNGQADIALTDHGRQQSAAFAGRFQHKKLTAIYSSDLLRCRAAADQIAILQGVSAEYKQELRELHIGEWEGLGWQQLQRDYPELWQARLDDIVNVAPPKGETLQQLADRVLPVILLDAIGASLDRLFHIEQDFACHNIIDYFTDGIAVVKQLNA